jgi:phosphopantothenoylcysteine decarboxylase/phosphopantothenate--cysteine ligase
MADCIDLAGKHLVLGLSGGIACYKAAELTRELVKAGATVQVVMTAGAEAFITAVTLQALSNRPVYTNVAQLKADGVTVLGPGAGDQACGEVGDGRMLEPDELRDELIAYFQPKRLNGRRLLITAGPTFEAIDPVRGITNHSSGKMGFAIARAAQEAGAEVTLVAGPVHLPTPRHVRRLDVQSAQQMHDAVLPLAAAHDVFVATAAVADWRPVCAHPHKVKKDGSGQVPAFEMTENPDILAAVARLPNRPYCVGFAAESHDLLRHATEKRLRKNVPLLVGNLGPATFGQDHNALLLVDAHGHRELPRADKLSLARALVQEIAQRLSLEKPQPT